jgi:hypothetical protein
MHKDKWWVGYKPIQHGSRGSLIVKVAHRLTLLPAGECRVLDCFAGDHDVWDAVARWRPDVRVTHIDLNPRNNTDLRGEAVRLLRGLDLDGYAGIDLDDWGLPTQEMKVIAERHFPGTVWFTANLLGSLPLPQLVRASLGLPDEWFKISPTVCLRAVPSVTAAIAAYVADLGYPEWVIASPDQKHNYGALNVAGWDQVAYEGHVQAVMASPVGRHRAAA